MRRLRGGDGTYRWFLVRYNPLRDDQGQIVRWYIAGTDIDDRKRAEEKLQQENVALREEIDKASMFEEIVGALAGADRRPVASLQGRRQRFDSPDHRRNRHRERTRRARDPPAVSTGLESVRGGELCGDSARLDRLRAIRSREGRVYRRRSSDGSVGSSWRTAERSSWTRWANSHPTPRSRCCECCKNVSSSESGTTSDPGRCSRHRRDES